jgi:hypothetical protein
MKTCKTIAMLAAVMACSAGTAHAFNILAQETENLIGPGGTVEGTITSWVLDDTSNGDGAGGADLTFVYQIHNTSGDYIGPIYLADFGNNTIYSEAIDYQNTGFNDPDGFWGQYGPPNPLTGVANATQFNGQNAGYSEVSPSSNEEAKFDYNSNSSNNTPLPNGAYSDALVVNTNISNISDYTTSGLSTEFGGTILINGDVVDLFSATANVLAPQGLPPAVPDAASTVSLFCIELGALAGLRRHFCRA